ncbi:extracellular solute-binding protein [uncultured Treponema sp.]|uniref:extracellular solute-binding protein n=1 Tax=uncultured Treponema sp. TaxID=162155 RepID=UPI0025E71347|nr:extracellular solute-binding protein [uncultured Treponema sp.]
MNTNKINCVKKIALTLTFSFSAMLFASCFSNADGKHYCTSNPNASLTLALRAGTYSDVIKNCLPNFEKEFNVRCDVIDFSESGLHDSIAKDTEGSYDLCMVDGSWMAEYTAKGILANLSELGYDLDSDIIPATKTICYHDGSVYLAPYYGNVTVLLYNRLMVKEAGFSPENIDSLEDILQICRFQKKRHNLGFMFRGDTANNIVVDFLPILLSRGTYVVDENNNPTVNTLEFCEAMYFYLSLLKTGRAAKKDDLIAAIANKSAAVGIGWPGWYTPTRNSSMDYIALSGKYRSDRGAYNSNIYGIWTIGIPENSNNKEYAVKLLKFLMDRDVQKSTVAYGGVPCRYSSLNDPEILSKFPQYEAVRKALEGGVYRPVMEEWSQFYTILGREMKLIINGEKSVQSGLNCAQIELEKMMAESKAQKK